MVNAQLYINNLNLDRNSTSINISGQNLEGSLVISGFSNLRELNCSNNRITFLDITNVSHLLETLNASNNQISQLNWNLSVPTNLRVLNLANNNWYNNSGIWNFSSWFPLLQSLDVRNSGIQPQLMGDTSYISRNSNEIEWDARIINTNARNFRIPPFRIERVDIVNNSPYPYVFNVRGINQTTYCVRVTFSNAHIIYDNGTFNIMNFSRFAVNSTDVTGQNVNLEAESFYYFMANLGREVQIPVWGNWNFSQGNFWALNDSVLNEIRTEKAKWDSLGYTLQPSYSFQQNIVSMNNSGDLRQDVKRWVDANISRVDAQISWQAGILVPQSTTNQDGSNPDQRKFMAAAVTNKDQTGKKAVSGRAFIAGMKKLDNGNWRVYMNDNLSDSDGDSFLVNDDLAYFFANNYKDTLDLILTSPLGRNVYEGVTSAARVIESGPAVSLDTTAAYRTALKTRWNSDGYNLITDKVLSNGRRNNCVLLNFKNSIPFARAQTQLPTELPTD